jgi:signal transduction histidine kinase
MRRWLYYALSLVVLGIGVRALDAQSRVGALPDLPPGTVSYPARLNGLDAARRGELEALAQRVPPGSIARIESASGTTAIPVGRANRFEEILISAICGFLFWSVALFVFADRVRWIEAHLLFFGTLFYGLVIWVGSVYLPGPEIPGAWVLPMMRAALLPVLPAMFVTLALVFPRRHPMLDRWAAAVPIILGTGIVVGIAQAVAFQQLAVAPGPERAAVLRAVGRVSDLLLIAGDGLGCWLLYRSTKRLQLAREQRQGKWVLWGITIGVTPYAFLHVLPRLIGSDPLIPLWAARLATVTIPAAFTIAVVKYRFLDIDLIIRRSVIYGLLAGVMVGLYLLLGVALGNEVRKHLPHWGGLVSALAVAVPVALFSPTRRFIGRWVDRTFFAIQYGYDRALRKLGAAMWGAASARELGRMVERFLEEHLAPSSVLVVLSGEDAGSVASRGLPRADLDSSDSGGPYARRIVAYPASTSVPEIEGAHFPEALASLGYRVLVQLEAGGRHFGHILLGERKSGWRYVEQDLDMLGRLSLEAARALERAELLQRMFAEAAERKRLDALDRMKSEFLFRVAHDLRTPIASIAWSNQNLLDGIVGPLEPRQREYLEGVDAAARQLERLVDNLLEVGRLEVGTERLEPEPVDLATVAPEATRILAPLAASARVRLATNVAAGLPRVRGNRGKVLQVLMNVMENAVKYAPPDSVVEIAVGADGGDSQRVEVRDRGPGIPAKDRTRIFDLHQQGAPSPYSSHRGFGLGLYVVKSYVNLMGGSVEAENHPEGGAIVSCRFQNWTEAKE